MFIETPIGRVRVMTRSVLDAFKCTCGKPGCTGDSVDAYLNCGHGKGTRVIYLKHAGALVVFCPVKGCGQASAFRVAGEG